MKLVDFTFDFSENNRTIENSKLEELIKGIIVSSPSRILKFYPDFRRFEAKMGGNETPTISLSVIK